MALDSLKQLYIDQLRDLYNAEQQILEALPKMAEKAKHQELRNGFQMHERQTQEQVRRLEQIFRDLGDKPTGETCEGMKGLLKEAQKKMKERADSDVLDAALIANAQRVEHYEIAGYGCARTFARLLGRERDAELLQQTLEEEGQTDHKLTQLAERVVNVDAIKEGDARIADREVELGGTGAATARDEGASGAAGTTRRRDDLGTSPGR